jgi:hypothetical protein
MRSIRPDSTPADVGLPPGRFLFLLPEREEQADAAAEAFQELYQRQREHAAPAIVQLEQPVGDAGGADRDEPHRLVALAVAAVPGPGLAFLLRGTGQRVRGAVAPERTERRDERVLRVGAALDHVSAHALEDDIAFGIPQYAAAGIPRAEEVLLPDEVVGESSRDEEGIVVMIVEAQADGLEFQRALDQEHDPRDELAPVGLPVEQGEGFPGQVLRLECLCHYRPLPWRIPHESRSGSNHTTWSPFFAATFGDRRQRSCQRTATM